MLGRLLARVKSLLGFRRGEGDSTAPGDAAASPAAAYACAICGTRVADPNGPCSLCRSTEIVPAGQSRREADEEGRLSGDAKTATSASNADEDAARLQAIREARSDEDD